MLKVQPSLLVISVVKDTRWEETCDGMLGPVGTVLQEVSREVCRGGEGDAPVEELEDVHFHLLVFFIGVRAGIGASLCSIQKRINRRQVSIQVF